MVIITFDVLAISGEVREMYAEYRIFPKLDHGHGGDSTPIL